MSFLTYAGWMSLFLAVIGIVVLIALAMMTKDDSQEKFGQKNFAIIFATAVFWTLGCVLLANQDIFYLNVINAGMAGKLIITIFTGKPWR